MRRLSILGATGSIGRSALDVAARGDWRIIALTGGANVEALADAARATGAEIAVTAHEDRLPELRERLTGSGVEVAAGACAIAEAAARPADVVVNGIVGAAGLAPSLSALGQGARLALANKESLVCAGPLVMEAARTGGAEILPVDSEHSAVFQALAPHGPADIERVVITASGGALRDWPAERLPQATPEDAGAHPNWDMGQRITIDSASMFNKALEVIEARELFGLEPARIEVLMHAESIVHAIVGFRDGAMIGHLGMPDMRHAIAYALSHPERAALDMDRLDLAALGSLTFAAPDEARWPALRLAREVMQTGGHAGAVFNAAKEEALTAFIDRRIRFDAMAGLVEEVLGRIDTSVIQSPVTGLEGVMEADHLAREAARALMVEDRWT